MISLRREKYLCSVHTAFLSFIFKRNIVLINRPKAALPRALKQHLRHLALIHIYFISFLYCLDRIHTLISIPLILAIPEVGLAATVALLELVAAQAALLIAHLGLLALHSGEASVVLFATVTLACLACFPAIFGAGRR